MEQQFRIGHNALPTTQWSSRHLIAKPSLTRLARWRRYFCNTRSWHEAKTPYAPSNAALRVSGLNHGRRFIPHRVNEPLLKAATSCAARMARRPGCCSPSIAMRHRTIKSGGTRGAVMPKLDCRERSGIDSDRLRHLPIDTHEGSAHAFPIAEARLPCNVFDGKPALLKH
jgi:hypothetical protein